MQRLEHLQFGTTTKHTDNRLTREKLTKGT